MSSEYSARVYKTKSGDSYYLVSTSNSGGSLKPNAQYYEYCGSGDPLTNCYNAVDLNTGAAIYIDDYDLKNKYDLITGPDVIQKISQFNDFYSSKIPKSFFGSSTKIINPGDISEQGVCLKKYVEFSPLKEDGSLDNNNLVMFKICSSSRGGRKTRKTRKSRKSRKTRKTRKTRKSKK
jgi:hypothetical protein